MGLKLFTKTLIYDDQLIIDFNCDSYIYNNRLGIKIYFISTT